MRIRYGDQVAAVDLLGGGLRSYLVGGVDVVDGYLDGARAPSGAGQVLAPWPNRLRNGRYERGAHTHQLPVNDPETGSAIHGLVRGRPWQLVNTTSDAVVVECQLAPSPGYPFGLALATRWSLSDDGLRADHTARCTTGESAPFGLGVHPYLLVPGVNVDDVVLTVPADRVVLTDGRHLPTATVDVVGTALDHRSGRRIGSALLDSAFTGLHRDDDGHAVVRLAAADGRGVELWADASFGWLQVFTGDTVPAPRTRRAVAVEPMSCPADAFNSGAGLVELQPGAVWRGSWGIRRTPST